MASELTRMPRSASSSSTSRWLRLNRKYSQTAWLMISAGKRWRRYKAGSTGTARCYLAPLHLNLSTPGGRHAAAHHRLQHRQVQAVVVTQVAERLGLLFAHPHAQMAQSTHPAVQG